MNLFFASRRLNYFLRARHRKGHGIHSPFVFNLFSDFFLNKPDSMVVKTVVDLLYKLQHARVAEKYGIFFDRSLKSGHFSAAERVEARGIRDWDKYCRLLALLSGRSGTLPVFQMGGGLRMATLAMAAGASGSRVILIEESANSEKVSAEVGPEAMPENLPVVGLAAGKRKRQKSAHVAEPEPGLAAEQATKPGEEMASIDQGGILLPGNIEVRLVDSFERQGKIGFEEGNAGLILINANSCRNKLLYCFEMVAGVVSEETIIVIENIHFSEENETGWKRLISDSRVSVSIDLLRYGLLFFRKGISKQHFLIRY
jgi:hypothetical protein